MAIEFDLLHIDLKLKDLKTIDEKLSYLNNILFQYEKKFAEINAYDKPRLNRLKRTTKADYETYKNEFDNGHLVYLQPSTNEATAKRLGIKNIDLLCERLELEEDFMSTEGKISVLKAKIKLISPHITENNTRPKNEFHEIFKSSDSLTISKELLEDLEITLNGKCTLKKWSGRLIGAIIALKETPGIFRADFTEQELLNFYNAFLGTNFITLDKRTKGFSEGYDSANRFIKQWRNC